MRRMALILLLLALALAACNGGSSESSPSSSSTSTVTVAPVGNQSPTATTTTTAATTTTTPETTTTAAATTTTLTPAGYRFEFETVDASGMTTVHMAAKTCGPAAGPWKASFDLSMASEALSIDGAGLTSFTLQPGVTVTGDALYIGTATPETDACEVTDFSEALTYSLTLDPFETSVGVIFGSKKGGTITFVCHGQPPITIPFAAAWGPQPIEVPIVPLGTCD